MKKLDLHQVAMPAIVLLGIGYLGLIAAFGYGVLIMYRYDSGLPGVIAFMGFAGIMSWVVFSGLYDLLLNYLEKMDLNNNEVAK